MAYPLRLGSEDGRRRLALIEQLRDEHPNGFTMASLPPNVCDDVRWLWAKDLLEVVSADPMVYKITLLGTQAIEDGPEQAEKLRNRRLERDERREQITTEGDT